MKILCTVFFLLLFLPSMVYAQDLLEKSNTSISKVLRLEYEQYQSNTLDLLDTKVGDLLSLARKIREDKALSIETRNELQRNISLEIGAITTYKQRLEKADTSEELRALFTEVQHRKTYSYFIRKTKMLMLLAYFENSLKLSSLTSENINKTIQNLSMSPKRKEKITAAYEEMAIRLASLTHAIEENKGKLHKTTNTSYEEILVDVRSDISTMGEEFGTLKKNISQLRLEFRKLQNEK